jgi:hypothetical protein
MPWLGSVGALLLLAGGGCKDGDPLRPDGGTGRGGGGGEVGTGGTVGGDGAVTSGAGGAGGVAGTGGGGGAGGAGGLGFGGAGGAIVADPPSCLRTLFAACPKAGSCTYAYTDGGQIGRFCYASGTRSEITSFGSCGANAPPTIEQVTKPDGSLCYTVETRVGQNPFCEGLTSSYRDAAGQVVATVNGAIGSTTVTCAASNQMFTCARNSQCSSDVSSEACQLGDCP